MKRGETNDEGVQKKIVKTIGIKSVAMCDNDEQLTPIMTGLSRPLQDKNGDIDNNPGDLALKKPNPHSQRVFQIHAEMDHTMLSLTLRRKIKSLIRKMTFDD